jgi:Fe-S cluster assembly protein SufD
MDATRTEAPAAREEVLPRLQPPQPGAGWTLHPAGSRPLGVVHARWLDAADASQRAELLAGLPSQDIGEGAALALAQRALCRQGVRLRIDESATAPGSSDGVWLQLKRKPQAAVEAPLLVIDVAEGTRCVLVEVHEPDADAHADGITQNLQVHLRIGDGATVQHLRIATPGPQDQWAHFVQARLGAGARYEQVLMAAGSGAHLQRTELELQAAQASASIGSVLFAAGSALEQQVRVSHVAEDTRSAVEALVLASGHARSGIDAHTHIAPGAARAEVRQRLSGIPTGGQPKLVLRPHLEIHHDQVQAAHGATWGALPEDALFLARQRGLDETQARALILHGMAQAVFDRALGDPGLSSALGLEAWVAQGVARHLASSTGAHHG